MASTTISKADSVARFKFKRTIDELSRKEGRGTELISLYVPPDRKIHEVLANLREEAGTASNIKSRTTRQNVEEAIERVSQRLRLWKEPPPTGLIIFGGAIPQNGPGSERMELFTLVPPEPIDVYFYRCDSRFHVEPLMALVAEKDTFGILVIDGQEAVVATLKGRRVDIVKSFTSGIAGKRRGGEEVVEKSNDILKGVRYNEEKQLVQKFLYELGHETGKGSFGEADVVKHLEKGIVDMLLISEALEGERLVVKCRNCGYEEETRGTRFEMHAVRSELASRSCPKCGKATLGVEKEVDVIDDMLDLAEKSATRVEVVSAETEEGRMLRDSFGKVAAVLRYGVK